ncbi:MAG: DUF3310 domain-containing protein [Poseidonibacter sp.]
MREKQVGGNHYSKRAIQPFHIAREYDLDFFEGNVLKYLLRHKDKNGLEDLQKAMHYLEEVIANEESKVLKKEYIEKKESNE